MALKVVKRQEGIRRIVLRPARLECLPIVCEGGWPDRKYHEEVVLKKCGDDRSPLEFEADRDEPTTKAAPEPLGPGPKCHRVVVEDASLKLAGASFLQANVMLSIGPVQADKCREIEAVDLHRASHVGCWSGHAEPSPRRQYGEPVEAATPENSLWAKAHPRARS